MTQFLTLRLYPKDGWGAASLEILYSTDFYSEESCIPELPIIDSESNATFKSGRSLEELQNNYKCYVSEEQGYRGG